MSQHSIIAEWESSHGSYTVHMNDMGLYDITREVEDVEDVVQRNLSADATIRYLANAVHNTSFLVDQEENQTIGDRAKALRVMLDMDTAPFPKGHCFMAKPAVVISSNLTQN